MARTNLEPYVVRIPTKSTYRDLISAKFNEHDAALDAVAGDGLTDPTETVSASGTLSATKPESLIAGSVVIAGVLPDGLKVGQRKVLRMVSIAALRSIAHTAGDNIVAATKTITLANGAFTAADVGRVMTLGSTAGGTNNGAYVIASVTSGTVAVFSTTVPADETFGSGVTASLAVPSVVVTPKRPIAHAAGDAVVSATKTITLSNAGFVATDVGRTLVLSGTSGGTNNGSYTIATVVSPTVVTVTQSIADETFGSGVISSIRGLIDGTNGTVTFAASEQTTELVWTPLGWRAILVLAATLG